MNKNTFFLIVLLFSGTFTRNYLEIDLGSQTPQGVLDKYNEPGYSIRGTYSHIDELFPFVRYDFSVQYLKFKDEYWNEYLDINNSPAFTVNHSEQAFGFFLGPRLMSPTKHGAFRPYIGFKVGGMFFSETMKVSWEEEDDTFFECVAGHIFFDEYDCDGDTQSSSETIDSKINLGALLEIGSNMNFSDKFGLDFGVQYNIIPSVRPEISLEQIEVNADDDPELENTLFFNSVSKTINADYLTFYFGINFKIGE